MNNDTFTHRQTKIRARQLVETTWSEVAKTIAWLNEVVPDASLPLDIQSSTNTRQARFAVLTRAGSFVLSSGDWVIVEEDGTIGMMNSHEFLLSYLVTPGQPHFPRPGRYCLKEVDLSELGKTPTVVEAMQVKGTPEMHSVYRWVESYIGSFKRPGVDLTDPTFRGVTLDNDGYQLVIADRGVVSAPNWGSWVVRSPTGEFVEVSDKDFIRAYEVDSVSPTADVL